MKVTAAALIIDKKRILLVQRPATLSTYPNAWLAPGGHAKKGENALQAVVREVEEEVGLDFTPTRLFMVGTWDDRELNRFLGTYTGEIHVQPKEVAHWGWLSYQDAIKLVLAFDFLDVIEKLHQENLI